MKKLTISIGLVAALLSAKAQDTTCTMFKGKKVLEFNYYTSEVINTTEDVSKCYEIDVKYGDVLCLDFLDNKKVVDENSEPVTIDDDDDQLPF